MLTFIYRGLCLNKPAKNNLGKQYLICIELSRALPQRNYFYIFIYFLSYFYDLNNYNFKLNKHEKKKKLFKYSKFDSQVCSGISIWIFVPNIVCRIVWTEHISMVHIRAGRYIDVSENIDLIQTSPIRYFC